jgi:hypothetical protein
MLHVISELLRKQRFHVTLTAGVALKLTLSFSYTPLADKTAILDSSGLAVSYNMLIGLQGHVIKRIDIPYC